ncbi:hypothetical protein RHGRI_009732 [Rhododendron griersonianum]|uniref:Uncharacterized protein n=1 Tax=Rhododendron griersonianum TaxID=479676 RepID=A0AAV6KFV8_9ERIC|nr:hypothetical protein RHGRI_009732 [Rhododendron griersonianum]KAG5551408.1 hypothetical protein RHGRI_009732 [Rhododendron griersonianum]
MECVQKRETKRKRTTTTTTILDDDDDNTGDEVESSRCSSSYVVMFFKLFVETVESHSFELSSVFAYIDSQADGNTVSKANKEVVVPEANTEKASRTVYVSGIPLRASREEVNLFFSSVCKVRNIDLILDPSLNLPKAVGYIEFDDPIYVSMAVDLSGQLLLGQPIEVEPLNVGNPSAGERSYIHTGKKNFIDKPWDMMTSDERIDASTDWRELTDVENRRFFYNKVTGKRRWSIPVELGAARNRADEAAQSSRGGHVPFLPPVMAHSNCQQVFGAPSQVAPWPQYPAYPLPQYSACPLPQYSACPLPPPLYPAYPLPPPPYPAYPLPPPPYPAYPLPPPPYAAYPLPQYQYQYQAYPFSGVAM